jgi:hypothetical protein
MEFSTAIPTMQIGGWYSTMNVPKLEVPATGLLWRHLRSRLTNPTTPSNLANV